MLELEILNEVYRKPCYRNGVKSDQHLVILYHDSGTGTFQPLKLLSDGVARIDF